MFPQSSITSYRSREEGLSEAPWYKAGSAIAVIPHRLSSWQGKMLICHHRHQPMIYATWAQTNSQIILLFLSLNEKETQALDVIRFRCEMGIRVNQCGAAVGAAKARGGVSHHPAGQAPAHNDVDVCTAEQLVSSPHCVVMRIWWDSLSAEHQEPLGLGVCALSTTLQACHATLAPQLSLPLVHRALTHNHASMAQLCLRTRTCSAPMKCKEKHISLDHIEIILG